MKTLPEKLTAYKRTNVFDKNSVPKGFLSEHTTKAGTWGVITIESGQLTYFITEPGCEEEVVLSPSQPGIIEPGQPHHIRLDGEVSFFVEFYK